MRQGDPVFRRSLLFGAAALPAALACRGAHDPVRAQEDGARLDELLSDLHDRSGEVEPIAQSEHQLRRVRTAAAMDRAGVQALLCEGGASMSWLTGVPWGLSERVFVFLLFADGSHCWLSPAFEAEKARLRIAGENGPGGAIATWEEHEYAFEPLAALLRERRVERLAIDAAARWFLVDRLGESFGRERLSNAAPLIGALRATKDEHELKLLSHANQLTKQALAAAALQVHAGMRTADISALVTRAQERLGLRSPWNLSLVGPAAAYPHGDTAAQVLGRGDLLLVDTGGTLHGYQSDITRTWVGEGTPRERELRAWHSVRSAQQRAFEAIRPGVECREIDRTARASLAADGWGEGYAALTHRLGHGIGVEGHEDPYFDSGSRVLLAPGMTLSNEPGIYVLGEFGVRIEDIVAVTADGAQVFGAWQNDPSRPD